MRAYEVEDGDEYIAYAGTLEQARTMSKAAVQPVFLPDVHVHEVEVKTDKDAVIAILNGEHKLAGATLVTRTGRKWRMSSKGTLREEFPAEADGGAA